MKLFTNDNTRGGALARFNARNQKKRLLSRRALLPLLLVAVFSLFTNAAWADSYSYTLAKSDFTTTTEAGTQTHTSGNIEWTLTSTDAVNYIGSHDTKGLQLGSSSSPMSNFTLSTSGINGTITKITVNASIANNGDWKLSAKVGESEYITSTSLTTTATDYSGEGTSSGNIEISFTGTSKAVYIKTITIEYSNGTASTCNAPTFNPANGTTFVDNISVELSCATDGATIYYTTDGSDPSASSAQYTEALSISETTTVKAIAIDASGALENSGIVSATYTKLSVLDGIKGLRTQIESDNNSSAATYAVKLTDAVVTFVAATSKCYIEQDGVGIMFYKSGHGFSAGDTFNGTATVTAYMYNGNAEVTSIDLTPTSGTAPEPTVITVKNVEDDFFNYGLRYVKIENGTVGATAITSDNRNSTITDASSTTELTLRSSSTDLTADANATVNVTGVCEKYDSNAQFIFYSIEAVSTTKKFEFSAETATATVGDDFTEPTLTNEYGTTATYSSSNTSVATVDESTGDVTIVAAGETTITATDGTNSASYTLTVSEASTSTEVSDKITIDSFGGGSSSYADYTQYTSSTTGVVYDGYGANGNSCIQLRFKDSKSGIIAYSGTRTLVSVEVSWYAQTTSGRTLDVYGNTTAYSSPAALYSTDTQGTKLGSIVCGTSTSLVLTAEQLGQYNAVGLRSNSGAMYLEYVLFTWSDGSTSIERFAFSSTTATARIGQDFTEPTLTNTYGTTATYSSSDTNVATVDANTGDVTLFAAGETTITATDGTNSASYTLTVKEALVLTGDGTFEKPYTVADVKALYDAGITVSEQVWVVGTIVGSAKDATNLNESGSYANSNLALAADATSTDFIPVQLTGNLRSVANVKDNTDNIGKEVKVYGKLEEYFKTAGMKSTAKIYGLTTIDIKTAEGYATYYNDYAYEMPAGVQGSTVVYDESSKSLTMSWGYTEGKTVPNTSALLLYGTKGTYNIVVVNSNVSADTENNLYGSTTEVTPDAEDGYYFYKLAYENENLENLGWYWGAEDGAPFASAANLCYLKIQSTTSTATPMSFLIGGEATGISSVTTDGASTTQPIYSVSGVRMNGDANSLPKGLYIVGGKKVIIK